MIEQTAISATVVFNRPGVHALATHVGGGLLVTCAHVALRLTDLYELIAQDPTTDLAFMRMPIDPEIPTLDMALDEMLARDQLVAAVLNRQSLTIGTGAIVSLSGALSFGNYVRVPVVAHTIGLAKGDSGGAVIDEQGRLVAVNCAAARGGGAAIPIWRAKRLISQIQSEN